MQFRMTASQVIDEIKAKGIQYVDMQMVDVPGKLNHVTIPAYQIAEEDMHEGFDKVDGSSLRGFTDIQDSDMIIKPDPNTFAMIPWSDPSRPMARMIGDIYLNLGRGRFSRDPRSISQKAEAYLKQKGFSFSLWGPEVEFFVFDSLTFDVLQPYKGQSYSINSKEAAWSSEGAYPIRFKEGYYPATPQDTLLDYRNEVSSLLFEHFHLPVEAHHHEVATAGQVEINIRRDTLTNTADGVSTLKYVAKNVAVRHGKVATMMPKPLAMDNGSGMHIHVSLWSEDDPAGQELLQQMNLFYDPDDEYAEISQLARYFVGGLLEHSRSLCSIVAPTVNSYRRLVPGFEAPTYVAWSRGNRSAIVRVPVYKRGNPEAKRIEFRAPDPSCNPYLAFSAVLMAGIDGIQKKIDCGSPVDENIYHLSEERRREMGVKELPGSLMEAIQELKSDREYLKPVFTDDLIDVIVERAISESKQVQMRPHPYEFYLYSDS
ncbi:MAG: type I glutamate--ammonia ligase [Conexivisphaerales archaeon]